MAHASAAHRAHGASVDTTAHTRAERTREDAGSIAMLERAYTTIAAAHAALAGWRRRWRFVSEVAMATTRAGPNV